MPLLAFEALAVVVGELPISVGAAGLVREQAAFVNELGELDRRGFVTTIGFSGSKLYALPPGDTSQLAPAEDA